MIKIQKCTNTKCNAEYNIDKFLFNCPTCNGGLEYRFLKNGEFNLDKTSTRNDLWRFSDLISIQDERKIISLDAGNSRTVLIEEMSELFNGANLYVKLDSEKNPTGTFKDREASIIFSKCQEQNLDNLVFYSTSNTGRAYTHYAAHLGLTTYLFLPKQCQYKNTTFIKRNKNNFIILVDDNYPEIGPYVKKFAEANKLNQIAPIHDRNEAYATLAYEQFIDMPHCDYFVQTIASGMGPIGFYKGHKNLVDLGLEKKNDIPKIICVQSSEMNVMSKAYNNGKKELSAKDMPTRFEENLFEPTLNSTNPVKNYPQLMEMLNENNGIITEASPEECFGEEKKLIESLKKRNIFIRTDLEKSLIIGFTGIVKLAKEGYFKRNENIMLLSVGRGQDTCTELIKPDAIINPRNEDPKKLFDKLWNNL